MLLKLIAAGVAVYSPHTAFDSAAEGINQRLAEGLGLTDIAALVPHQEGQGAGRWGKVDGPLTLGELAQRLMKFLGIANLQMVGNVEQKNTDRGRGLRRGGRISRSRSQGRQRCHGAGRGPFPYLPGGRGLGIGLLLPGHFASERFAVEELAGLLGRQFPEVQVWASRQERDPLRGSTGNLHGIQILLDRSRIPKCRRRQFDIRSYRICWISDFDHRISHGSRPAGP